MLKMIHNNPFVLLSKVWTKIRIMKISLTWKPVAVKKDKPNDIMQGFSVVTTEGAPEGDLCCFLKTSNNLRSYKTR